MRHDKRFLELEDILQFIHLHYHALGISTPALIAQEEIPAIKRTIRKEVPTMGYTYDLSNNEITDLEDSEKERNEILLSTIEEEFLTKSTSYIYNVYEVSIPYKTFEGLLWQCFRRRNEPFHQRANKARWGEKIVVSKEVAMLLPKYSRRNATSVGVSIKTLQKYGIQI